MCSFGNLHRNSPALFNRWQTQFFAPLLVRKLTSLSGLSVTLQVRIRNYRSTSRAHCLSHFRNWLNSCLDRTSQQRSTLFVVCSFRSRDVERRQLKRNLNPRRRFISQSRGSHFKVVWYLNSSSIAQHQCVRASN